MPQFKAPKLKIKGRKQLKGMPCGAELLVLMNCWAGTGDTLSTKQCLQSTQALEVCMASHAKGASAVASRNKDIKRLSNRL